MSGGGTIGDLVAKLERLGARQVEQAIVSEVQPVAHDECLRGFVEQRNPYGTPWAPRLPPTGSWKLLDKTGRGINSLTSSAIGGAVVLRIIGYMRFHQISTYRMQARKFFPDPALGLGSWSEPIRDASLRAVGKLMSG